MQPTNQAIPTLMTTRQLCQALALSRATVHRARKAGRITPAIVMSRAVRWDPRLVMAGLAVDTLTKEQ